MSEERVLRQLAIKAFHVRAVSEGEKVSLKKEENKEYSLVINPNRLKDFAKQEELIEDCSLKIIHKNERHIPINSIMDIMPISTKVLGKIGEGISHTLTGVYVILTATDTEGNYVSAFGNSDGFLDEQVVFGRAGTPGPEDIIILIDVVLQAKVGYSRPGPDACHRLCDHFCQEIREVLKKTNGSFCTERHDFKDVERPGKDKVVLVKMVSGQGAMYDTRFLPDEPSGFIGSHSIIDITGAPMIISPNEYRDGAIRALY